MRKLVHISDLHFGRVDYRAVSALEKAIVELRPDVVAVSGDLTQRARRGQFRDAASFLDRLPFPRVVVPGNHDVPLYDVVRRFLSPLGTFRCYLGDPEPLWEDGGAIVAGVNTARSFTVSGGHLSTDSLRRLRERLDRAAGKIRVVVCHHPLDLFDRGESKRLRAAGLLPLAPDFVLTGHLHAGSAEATASLSTVAHRSCILVQGGTATSTRLRGEGNTFNVLELESERATVVAMRWTPETPVFSAHARRSFTLGPGGWTHAST